MPSSDLAERIRRMPKAELHIHVEGALRWSTVRELNPQALELGDSPPWLGGAFASFDDFRSIFHAFLLPATGTEERIERLMFEMLEDLARQNVCYAEPILYLPFHRGRGLSVRDVLGAVQRGIVRAEREYAIACRLIIGLNRSAQAEKECECAREALEVVGPGGSALVAGLDVMSDDRFGIHPAFVELYRDASRRGLRLKVHAGEMGGADVVRDALEKLEAPHLSHGVRACEDENLLRELAAGKFWFHTCPTSNILMGVAPDYPRHPIKRLLDAGCILTLNSDDPLLYGVNITDEYLHAAFDMGFSAEQIKQLAMNGIAATLLSESEKHRLAGEGQLLFW